MADDHNAQIAQYLQFLRRKREAAISEVTAEFNETKETRLFDDNYHVDDVVAILDGLVRELFPSIISALIRRRARRWIEARGPRGARRRPAPTAPRGGGGAEGAARLRAGAPTWQASAACHLARR